METLIAKYIESCQQAESADKKRQILSDLWGVLQKENPTFYIALPGTNQAKQLYEIAQECAKHKEGKPPTNGDIWQTLMPTLQHTETACRDEFPEYELRDSLIITDNCRHLLSIPEMCQFYKQDPSLDTLPNFYHLGSLKGALSESERRQVFDKNPALWSLHYERPKPWMSQQTYEKLVFITNIITSNESEIDSNFESRFAEGLRENRDFATFYAGIEVITQGVENDPSKIDAREELKLTCCFEYFFAYLKTLPQEEGSAFKLIKFGNNVNIYGRLMTIYTYGVCMSGLAILIADFVRTITSQQNNHLLKHNVLNEAPWQRNKGANQSLVRASEPIITEHSSYEEPIEFKSDSVSPIDFEKAEIINLVKTKILKYLSYCKPSQDENHFINKFDKGFNRAQGFLNLLKDPAFSNDYKLFIIHSLLKEKQGKRLKKFVSNDFQYQQEQLIDNVATTLFSQQNYKVNVSNIIHAANKNGQPKRYEGFYTKCFFSCHHSQMYTKQAIELIKKEQIEQLKGLKQEPNTKPLFFNNAKHEAKLKKESAALEKLITLIKNEDPSAHPLTQEEHTTLQGSSLYKQHIRPALWLIEKQALGAMEQPTTQLSSSFD